MKRIAIALVASLIVTTLATSSAQAASEDDYYHLVTFDPPEGVILEVSGLLHLKDGRIMLCTRGGEVYIVENGEAADPSQAKFKRYAFGLATPLGLWEHTDGYIYVAQRGELTRMKDIDGDDQADIFETVCDDWAISGNYHEFCFGPRPGPEGKFWVTLNKPFGGEPYGRAKWRGWSVRIDLKTGKMEAMCNGLRSPCGVENSPWGDMFYTDNQGEWCNASKLSQLVPGTFHGHPHGLDTVELPECTLKEPKASDVPNGEFMKDLRNKIPNFQLPTLWFPYEKMGKSPSGLKWDQTGGKFGPFAGQIFVGDQHHAWVMRCFIEKVDGHWQGACFRFREGLMCGVLRMAFGNDGQMFVGMSNAGWGSKGTAPWGLQRIVWNGKMPFEIHEMHVKPDGFELTSTKPVDAEAMSKPEAYKLSSYTYRLRSNYGGPEEDVKQHEIKSVTVGADGKSVRLVIDGLRAGYVHELHIDGAKAKDGTELLHPEAYYTVINIPGGTTLDPK
ncbi:MAG: hypothetical protein GC159_13875 [Phycisphaera sp.]|nr:hypothetical protein [Phycisphaera sp.]